MNHSSNYPEPTNLPNDESRAGEIIAANVTLLLIASIFLVARIYSRSLIQRCWKPDDYFIVIAWVLYVAHTTVSSLQIRYGAGRHIVYVPAASFPPFFITTHVCNLLYALYQWAIKMSLALLYLRAFNPAIQVRKLIYGLIAFISVYCWIHFVLVACQCIPNAAIWDPNVQGHCMDLFSALISSAVISVCVDLALIVILIPRVVRLKLRRPQKIALLLVINLGWVSIVATILRTLRVCQLFYTLDFTWHVLDFIRWTALEISTTMICASAPVIGPLLRKCTLMEGWMGTLRSDGQEGIDETTGQSESEKSTRVRVVGYESIELDRI